MSPHASLIRVGGKPHINALDPLPSDCFRDLDLAIIPSFSNIFGRSLFDWLFLTGSMGPEADVLWNHKEFISPNMSL